MYVEWNANSTRNAVRRMTAERNKIKSGGVENLHVIFSEGNRKLGRIKSVSLLPVFDCGKNCKYCKRFCYDNNHDCVMLNVMHSRAVNSVIHETDLAKYWREVSAAMVTERYFRINVGGDIYDEDVPYLVVCAEKNQGCEILVFTKNYDAVNDYVAKNGNVPKNLHIVFSACPGIKRNNPYNFPESHIIFPDGKTTLKDGEEFVYCGGNCTECARSCDVKKSCWNMGHGDRVAFRAH